MKNAGDVEKIIHSLSPIERQIVPFLSLSFSEIVKKARVDETTALRALEFLSNKGIVKLSFIEKKEVVLGANGVLYRKQGLPERKLLDLLSSKPILSLQDAQKLSDLGDNEFKAALGALKRKVIIDLRERNVVLRNKEAAAKKMLEEIFIEKLPLAYDRMKEEEKYCFEQLKNRKDIIRLEQKKEIHFELTELGKKIKQADIKKVSDLIEQVTSDILRGEEWKGKKFRRYDVKSPVPKIYGGKRHFVNQAIDYARKVWTELGFKEMQGNLCQTGFWNFDALFTAQDHPVRELQDTLYLKGIKGKLPEKELIKAVKEAHEKGVAGSKGWSYKWSEDEAKRVILRTHTTVLSAQTLAVLGKIKNIKDKRGKFFAIGKCFRNETVDWGHLFEFNQTEGIVVDKDANFKHLLGYLEEFFKRMGFEKVKFFPSYFPYTEPSVEIFAFHSAKQIWMEVGGAGIFRPEVVIPLLGEFIPVLAWGPGFDRSLMEYYNINDLRELYENDINKLREIKFWVK